MAGPFLIHTTAPLKCLSDEKLYVKHVILEKGGQTHPIQRKEVKNCLMINQLLSEGGKQGKQTLWKKLLMVQFSSYSEDEVSGILARNIEYNGSRYCFLGFSELQLKNKTCFLIAETDKQIGERRTTFANLSVTIPFADRVAKVQHMFEPYEKSLQLTEDEFIFENNAEITEESGFMSPELAEKIKKTAEYNLANDPSVVQVICPGFSGKLVLSDEILAKARRDGIPRLKALLKTSGATKDCGNSLTVGIVDYSKPYKVGYLDIYTVMLLSERGVASDYLLELQKHYYDVLTKLETDLTSAKYFLRLNGRKDILGKIDNGINPDARETICQIKGDEIRKMQENEDHPKLRILVSESREVFGILDPYDNQLQSSECVFAPCLNCLQPQERELFESAEQVLVIPQPCYSATDIRVLKLVCNKGEYEKLKDCIVLPSQTETQFVSRKYFVCWDKNLLPQSNSAIWNILSEIPSKISTILPGLSWSNVMPFLWCGDRPEDTTDRVGETVTSEADTSSTATELHEDASFQEKLKKYFANFKSSDDLISRAKSHFKEFALLKGSPSCRDCKTLGKYLSPSFDWNAKRDEAEKYVTNLGKEGNQESTDESSTLQKLCGEMTDNLHAFIEANTEGQR